MRPIALGRAKLGFQGIGDGFGDFVLDFEYSAGPYVIFEFTSILGSTTLLPQKPTKLLTIATRSKPNRPPTIQSGLVAFPANGTKWFLGV